MGFREFVFTRSGGFGRKADPMVVCVVKKGVVVAKANASMVREMGVQPGKTSARVVVYVDPDARRVGFAVPPKGMVGLIIGYTNPSAVLMEAMTEAGFELKAGKKWRLLPCREKFGSVDWLIEEERR